MLEIESACLRAPVGRGMGGGGRLQFENELKIEDLLFNQTVPINFDSTLLQRKVIFFEMTWKEDREG